MKEPCYNILSESCYLKIPFLTTHKGKHVASRITQYGTIIRRIQRHISRDKCRRKSFIMYKRKTIIIRCYWMLFALQWCDTDAINDRVLEAKYLHLDCVHWSVWSLARCYGRMPSQDAQQWSTMVFNNISSLDQSTLLGFQQLYLPTFSLRL